jgi:hypothetical protein
MTRKPLTFSGNFAFCDDGTIWKYNPSSSGIYEPFIPARWIKLPPIPSDEEYEEQENKVKETWDNWNEEETKRFPKFPQIN